MNAFSRATPSSICCDMKPVDPDIDLESQIGVTTLEHHKGAELILVRYIAFALATFALEFQVCSILAFPDLSILLIDTAQPTL